VSRDDGVGRVLTLNKNGPGLISAVSRDDGVGRVLTLNKNGPGLISAVSRDDGVGRVLTPGVATTLETEMAK